MSSTNQEQAFWPSQTWNLTNNIPAFGWLYKIRGVSFLFHVKKTNTSQDIG